MVTGVFELLAGEVHSAGCEVPPGVLLTEAAEQAGVLLNVACGGHGSCGGCAMDLVSGMFLDYRGRPIVLAGEPKRVLGCRVRVAEGPFRVRVPRHSLVSAGEKVLVDFEHVVKWTLSPTAAKEFLELPAPSLHDQAGDIERIITALTARGYDHKLRPTLDALRQAPLACREGKYHVTATLSRHADHWHITQVQPGDTTDRLYAIAVDIGTTTVVCSLVDLVTGKIIDSASSYNQQIRRCDDVASRIAYASDAEKLRELQHLVVDSTINRLVALLMSVHELPAADIVRMSVACNTVMTHLFLGADPTHLGGVPFQPASALPPSFAAGELGLKILPSAPVDVAPSTAAYIGGDISADMYVCGMHETKALTVMVDIGTNAEIAVGNHDHVIACAAPAGPAFEGHGLRCGMRASIGAIETVEIDPTDFSPRFTVIGNVPPSGVCGSGLIDFLAQAFLSGLLTPQGRFDVELAAQKKCTRLVRSRNDDGTDVLAYVLVEAEQTDDKIDPVQITEADVAALLQAKGVIFAGIQIAVKRLGKAFADVEQVFLAGGFAKHINLRHAVAIGLLPDIPLERYRFIGNGSLAGAYLNLVDHNVAALLPHVAGRPDVIELNLDEDFQDAYTFAMFLPNFQTELFPSVQRS